MPPAPKGDDGGIKTTHRAERIRSDTLIAPAQQGLPRYTLYERITGHLEKALTDWNNHSNEGN